MSKLKMWNTHITDDEGISLSAYVFNLRPRIEYVVK